MEKRVVSFINIQESLLAANHLFILISPLFTSEDIIEGYISTGVKELYSIFKHKQLKEI